MRIEKLLFIITEFHERKARTNRYEPSGLLIGRKVELITDALSIRSNIPAFISFFISSWTCSTLHEIMEKTSLFAGNSLMFQQSILWLLLNLYHMDYLKIPICICSKLFESSKFDYLWALLLDQLCLSQKSVVFDNFLIE